MRERLYRSRSDRMLFGVAGGMARWLDVDPSIVRLVWALLLFTGIGFLLYLVAAVVIPEEPFEDVASSAAGIADADPTASQGADTVAGASGSTWASPSGQQVRRAGAARRDPLAGGNGAILFGIVLVVLGGWFLAQKLLPNLDTSLFWPALLIVLGIVLLVGALRGRDGANRP